MREAIELVGAEADVEYWTYETGLSVAALACWLDSGAAKRSDANLEVLAQVVLCARMLAAGEL